MFFILINLLNSPRLFRLSSSSPKPMINPGTVTSYSKAEVALSGQQAEISFRSMSIALTKWSLDWYNDCSAGRKVIKVGLAATGDEVILDMTSIFK